MKIKIAVVQTHVEQHNPESNLKKAEMFIQDAASKGANIIVFPEDFVTGPLLGKKEFADVENKYKKHFQKLAIQYNIAIVPGSFIEKDELGLFNTTYYISANGKIKSRYRKINLWHPEKSEINPGDKVSVFDTEFGRIGLLICSDLMYPEITRRIVRQGAEIIICPSYWTFEDAGVGQKYDKNSDATFIDSMCILRAFENEAVVVYCGAGGKLKGPNWEENLIGHSQITAPFLGVIKKLNHNEEEMFIQEVDTKIIKEAGEVYKIREDLRTRIMH